MEITGATASTSPARNPTSTDLTPQLPGHAHDHPLMIMASATAPSRMSQQGLKHAVELGITFWDTANC
jgi:hypothetical protein